MRLVEAQIHAAILVHSMDNENRDPASLIPEPLSNVVSMCRSSMPT